MPIIYPHYTPIISPYIPVYPRIPKVRHVLKPPVQTQPFHGDIMGISWASPGDTPPRSQGYPSIHPIIIALGLGDANYPHVCGYHLSMIIFDTDLLSQFWFQIIDGNWWWLPKHEPSSTVPWDSLKWLESIPSPLKTPRSPWCFGESVRFYHA